jgi:hypothetical protein
MAEGGYYCIIQYMPDPYSMESVALGVVLFLPKSRRLSYRLCVTEDRIVRCFGEGHAHALGAANAVASNLHAQFSAGEIRSVEALQHFIDCRANDIRLTDPRPAKVEGDVFVEASRLYDELPRY